MINNILFSIKKLSVNSILFFSSIDVYGKNPTLPVNEKTELFPDNYYAASKLINESSILNFKTDVPSVILRMPGIYGSPNDNVSIIGRFTEAIKNNHEIQINGTGAQLRDYIYIEDILKAIELISNNPKSGIFNFVTGYSISISSIINLISSSIGIKPQIIYNKKNSHNDDLIFDNNKFISSYDFFKFTDISNGIKNYLEKLNMVENNFLNFPNKLSNTKFTSVTGYTETLKALSKVIYPRNIKDCINLIQDAKSNGLTICPRGKGYTYGDMIINSNEIILDTSLMKNIVAWDKRKGVITVQPGVTFAEIFKITLLDNWTLSSCPGGLDITIGGSISNNVHGKDTWKEGILVNKF